MMSRKQLYAMGEPLGDSATRAKPGGRIYGSGGGAPGAAGAPGGIPPALQSYLDGAPPISTPIPSSVRSNPAAQQFNPMTAYRTGAGRPSSGAPTAPSPGLGMPALNIPPGASSGLLGGQPSQQPTMPQQLPPELMQQLQQLQHPAAAPVKTPYELMMDQMNAGRAASYTSNPF